ncbi:hypothetical protein HYN43_016555 [Mucilaginibacter celer]|uniref:Uncharacterized protein n=1 Tax=Mucilaginibacter celer TaxID=2305508 RepID=A0A494VZ75_9SPHI|nr:hypothetical protein HYN43_016555 [Mucilaginibacter celer]
MFVTGKLRFENFCHPLIKKLMSAVAFYLYYRNRYVTQGKQRHVKYMIFYLLQPVAIKNSIAIK